MIGLVLALTLYGHERQRPREAGDLLHMLNELFLLEP
jgi:hypothetical protein